jgi:hypothetical protein
MAAAPPALHPAAIKGAVTGAAIAADAVRYAGRGYVYGGTAATPGDWDCSSFVSYVLGHDLGLALPGGHWGQPGFPPGSHGPVVETYAAWGQPITEAQAGPGDLVCWVGAGPGGHIGIILGTNKMVSALNSQAGTLISPIAGYGPLGVPQVYRRISATAATAPGGGATGPAGAGGGGQTLLALITGTVVVGLLLAGIVGLAALAGAAASAGAGWLAAKAMES